MLNLIAFLVLLLFPLAAAAGPAVQAPQAGGAGDSRDDIVETVRIIGPPVETRPLAPAPTVVHTGAPHRPAPRPAALTGAPRTDGAAPG
jgi:hypothetical protein